MLSRLDRFAQMVGMPRAELMRLRVEHEAFAGDLANRVTLAAATARQTSRLLTWLPWLALAGAQVLGLGSLRFLLGGPLGFGLLAIAGAVGVLCSRLADKQVAAAQTLPEDPGLWPTAVALAFEAGVGVDQAMDALEQCGVGSENEESVRGSVLHAFATEGSIAARLREGAGAGRAVLRQQKLLQLEKLPFRLLLITGGLMLPQFMLLLMVPLLAGAFNSVR